MRGLKNQILFAHRNANAAACYDVFVNGQQVAQVQPNDQVRIPLNQGKNTVFLKSSLSSSNSVEFDASNGDRFTLYCVAKFAGLTLYR